MQSKYILFTFLVAALTSCSTAYKMGQTPDDVYFSPAPAQNEYVQVNNDEGRDVYDNSADDDREIRRRVNSRILRRQSLDYGYDYPYNNGYNRYDYAYGSGYNTYGYNAYGYNSYGYGYNAFDYPYAYGYINPPIYSGIKSQPSVNVYTAPRKSNLGTYRVPSLLPGSNNGGRNSSAGRAPVRSFNRTDGNRGTGLGNLIRRAISNPSSNTPRGNNTNTQTRTFEPSRSSNNSSSSPSTPNSSSNSGGSAPVRSFHR